MVKTYTTPPLQESQLIAEYILLWKSMGFDFDDAPSTYMTEEDDGDDLNDEMLSLKDLVLHMNAQKQEMVYELHEALKIVYAKEQRFWIKKFNVREVGSNAVKTVEVFEYIGPYYHDLVEWRLKDGCHETLPPQHHGQFPRPENAPETTPPPTIPNTIIPRTFSSKYPSWKTCVPPLKVNYEYRNKDDLFPDPWGPLPFLNCKRHCSADYLETEESDDEEVLEDEDFDLPDE